MPLVFQALVATIRKQTGIRRFKTGDQMGIVVDDIGMHSQFHPGCSGLPEPIERLLAVIPALKGVIEFVSDSGLHPFEWCEAVILFEHLCEIIIEYHIRRRCPNLFGNGFGIISNHEIFWFHISNQ